MPWIGETVAGEVAVECMQRAVIERGSCLSGWPGSRAASRSSKRAEDFMAVNYTANIYIMRLQWSGTFEGRTEVKSMLNIGRFRSILKLLLSITNETLV